MSWRKEANPRDGIANRRCCTTGDGCRLRCRFSRQNAAAATVRCRDRCSEVVESRQVVVFTVPPDAHAVQGVGVATIGQLPDVVVSGGVAQARLSCPTRTPIGVTARASLQPGLQGKPAGAAARRGTRPLPPHFRDPKLQREGARKGGLARAAKLRLEAGIVDPFAGTILDAMDAAGLTGPTWDPWRSFM